MFTGYQRIILPWLLNKEMGSEGLKQIRQEVLVDASGIVLEIGVGPGYNLPLYKNISKLYALEPSKELIEIARTRAEGLQFSIEFLNSGAENISLPSQSVDTVVSTWTLCSVDDIKKVLSEIRRVLKPEGKFIFVDHGASPNTGLHLIQTSLTALTKYFTGNCHYNRALDTLIIETGFNIEKIKHPKERLKPLIFNYQGVANLNKFFVI